MQLRSYGEVGFDRLMTIVLGAPGSNELNEVVDALREWPYDGAPVQLHPGDLGWY